jgi:hypothetical protein
MGADRSSARGGEGTVLSQEDRRGDDTIEAIAGPMIGGRRKSGGRKGG